MKIDGQVKEKQPIYNFGEGEVEEFTPCIFDSSAVQSIHNVHNNVSCYGRQWG